MEPRLTPKTTKSAELAWRIALALGVAVLVSLRLRDGTGNIIDDAYMTLRNAKQLALGNGLVYNPGEPCLGTTTPLYALLHGFVGALVGAERIPWSAVIGNALADGLSFVVVARWVRESARSRVVGLASAGLYAFSPRAIEFCSSAMEAPLYTLFILVALREATRGDERRAGLAAGLAQVCRPDGAVVGLVALLALARFHRRLPLRYVATAAVVVVPWLVFACAVYPHGPIPQSVIAKSHRPWTVPPHEGAQAFALQLAAYGPGRYVWIVGSWLRLVAEPDARLGYVGAVPTLVLSLLGARALDARGRREGTAVAVFGALYSLVFILGNPLMLGWYQVPIEAVLAILVPPAIASLVRDGVPSAGAWPGRASWAARALLALYVASNLFAAIHLRDHILAFTYLRERWDKRREQAYFACAERLLARAPHTARVQASENGVLGWAWPGPMLDTVGLDTPGAEKYYPPAHPPRFANMVVPAALILDMKPDYFVTLEVFVRETCLEDPKFLDTYEVDEVLSDRSVGTYASHGLLVFKRRK